jgi:hypothetical protein
MVDADSGDVQARADDKTARQFMRDLMFELRQKSKDEGSTLAQGLWVHHRLKNIEINITEEQAAMFPPLAPLVGVNIAIDLINLDVTGDIEIAYAALFVMAPDDGSQPYHWLTADNIAFIRHEVGSFLGWE